MNPTDTITTTAPDRIDCGEKNGKLGLPVRVGQIVAGASTRKQTTLSTLNGISKIASAKIVHRCQIRVFPKSFVVTTLFLLSFTGCVQRKIIIRSQPEGAFVMVDNQPVGRTPVPFSYVYSGTREIQLEKDGYKTVKVRERIRPKWYDKFPLSFFSNNFAFREIRDERVLDFELEPRTQVEENRLLERANDLRTNVERGTLTAPIR